MDLWMMICLPMFLQAVWCGTRNYQMKKNSKNAHSASGADGKSKIKKIAAAVIFLVSLLCIGGGIYYIRFSDEAVQTREAYARQDEEFDLADQYVAFLLEQAEKETEKGTPEGSDPSDSPSKEKEDETEREEEPTLDLSSLVKGDDVYYTGANGVTYTPEYAKGYLSYVLSIPSAKIMRGVYSGTWDDIYYDLEIWMVTQARPDLELGKTHMTIYGHNHTSQNLSFNNLKDVAVGDEFYIYAESGYYVYTVTDIFAEWRQTATEKYVDDFSLSSDKCYILTCGRDWWTINGMSTRYKDYIVEGTLKEHLTLREYADRVRSEEKK